ncbi:hypothetical protein HYW20_03565 [Candidatus Woesearchaeota archaeon]|nr:hypothetical protein [Candidatus Woesearchaeota archaeon]
MSKLIISISLLLLAYLLFLGYLKFQERKNSPKLDKTKVDKLILFYRNQLNLKNKKIHYEFTNKKQSNSELKNGIYFIKFGKSALEITVLHELFHIYRGDCDNHGKGIFNYVRIRLLYFFLFEPRTMIHSIQNKTINQQHF